MYTGAATIYNSIYMFVDSTGNLEGFAVGDNGVIASFSQWRGLTLRGACDDDFPWGRRRQR